MVHPSRYVWVIILSCFLPACSSTLDQVQIFPAPPTPTPLLPPPLYSREGETLIATGMVSGIPLPSLALQVAHARAQQLLYLYRTEGLALRTPAPYNPKHPELRPSVPYPPDILTATIVDQFHDPVTLWTWVRLKSSASPILPPPVHTTPKRRRPKS